MQITAMLAVAVVLSGQPSPNSASESGGTAELKNCIVSLIGNVQLPAEEAGILKMLAAKEGDIVKAGQELGKIDDSDAQARKKAAANRFSVAHEKATNDAELQVAKAIIDLALAEWEESLAINKRLPGSIPETTVRRQKVQWEKAKLDAIVAQMNFTVASFDEKVAEAEVETVANELARRTIKAPFDGVVVQLHRQESEWVQPGDPVLRVVRMDRLRVEGFMNCEDCAPEEIEGAAVTITVDLAGDQSARFQSTITHVSPLVEASGDYRIWAEVDNPRGGGEYPWLLRPGSEAQMKIDLKRPTRTAGR